MLLLITIEHPLIGRGLKFCIRPDVLGGVDRVLEYRASVFSAEALLSVSLVKKKPRGVDMVNDLNKIKEVLGPYRWALYPLEHPWVFGVGDPPRFVGDDAVPPWSRRFVLGYRWGCWDSAWFEVDDRIVTAREFWDGFVGHVSREMVEFLSRGDKEKKKAKSEIERLKKELGMDYPEVSEETLLDVYSNLAENIEAVYSYTGMDRVAREWAVNEFLSVKPYRYYEFWCFVQDLYPFFTHPDTGIFWVWDPVKGWIEERRESFVVGVVERFGLKDEYSRPSFRNGMEIMCDRASLRKYARPIEPGPEYLCFGGEVVRVGQPDERTRIVPSWFFVNAIPWRVGDKNETPTIDRLFSEWVGENAEMLMELTAYCCYRGYPIHKMFFLTGVGRNGKSTYLSLLERFLGDHNVVSVDLKAIIKERFESSRLYKKLLALCTEPGLSVMDTAQFKRLTGDDLLRGERKGKDAFDFRNYAKIVVATNDIPEVEDKSLAFFDRFVEINFPNVFLPDGGARDVLSEIPDEEYEALARRVVEILPVLLERRRFCREPSILEKQRIIERKSNPLAAFIAEYCEVGESYNVVVSEFVEAFNKFMENELNLGGWTDRKIGRRMKKLGFSSRVIGVNRMYEGLRLREDVSPQERVDAFAGQARLVECEAGNDCAQNNDKREREKPSVVEVASVANPSSGDSTRDLVLAVVDALDSESSGEGACFEEVLARLESEGVSRGDAEELIDIMISKGEVFEPRPGRLKRLYS